MSLPKLKTISSQFVAVTLVLICLLVLPFSAVFLSKYTEARVQANQHFLTEKESSTRFQAQQMVQFLARISPEAVMGQDLYSLQVFAEEAMRDSSVLSLQIKSAAGQMLLERRNEEGLKAVDSLTGDSIVRSFAVDVVTDKARLGIEQKVGTIEMQVSFLALEMQRRLQQKELNKKVAQVTWGLIAFAILLCVVLSGTIWFTLQRLLLLPLRRVSMRIHDIAVGEGDLTQRLDFGKDNEMGALANGMDGFMEKLQSMIRSIKERASALDKVLDATRADTVRLGKEAESMGKASKLTAGDTSSVSAEVNSVSQSMAELQNRISQLSQAVSEMNRALAEVSGNSALESRKSQEADVLTEASVQTISGLEGSVGSINQILGTIRTIANQTRLLALNATIEAASAGEAGKGFAVVASEVKELARRTADSTQGIQDLVEDIQTKMQATVQSIMSVRTKVGEMKEASSSVSASVEEQSITMQGIAGRIQEAASLTAQVGGAMDRSSGLLQKVSGNIAQLDQSVKSMSGGLDKAGAMVQSAANESAQVRDLVGRFYV